LNTEFVETVQKRGAAVIAARTMSSAMSAAKAAGDHMRDWWIGTKPGQFVSMGVISDGSYGIPKDITFSLPVTIKNKKYEIVQVTITLFMELLYEVLIILNLLILFIIYRD
jgi:malate dehydrogenase